MKTTINERFAKLLDTLNTNPSRFSKSVGKSYNAIESIIKGRTRPSYDVLESVFVSYPNINTDWLLMGEGEMFRKVEQVEQVEHTDQDAYLHEHLQTLEANFMRLAAQLEAKDQHIDRLTKMLETFVGKPEGATYRPLSNEEVVYKIRMYEYAMSVFGQPFVQSIFLP